MLLMVGATYAKTMIGMSMTRTAFVSETTTVVEQVHAQMTVLLELSRLPY
jgi:hypothetical protein